jgi:hypothetical protein
MLATDPIILLLQASTLMSARREHPSPAASLHIVLAHVARARREGEAGGVNSNDQALHHHSAAAVARAGAAPSAAKAYRTRWLLPARVLVIRIVLRAARGRAGRDPLAAERDLPARMDAQRQLLPAKRQSRLIQCLRTMRHCAGVDI